MIMMIMMIVIWRERASWRWSNTDIDTIYHRTSINRLSFSLPFLEKEKKKEINISDFTKPNQHKYKKWKLSKKGLYQHTCKHFFKTSQIHYLQIVFFSMLSYLWTGKIYFSIALWYDVLHRLHSHVGAWWLSCERVHL